MYQETRRHALTGRERVGRGSGRAAGEGIERERKREREKEREREIVCCVRVSEREIV
jgi:hypothetical protein